MNSFTLVATLRHMEVRFNRAAKARLLLTYRYLWRRRSLWLRGALCWAIGIGLLWANPSQNFDERFQLRDIQHPSPEIVLIQIDQTEWTQFLGKRRNWFRPLKDVGLTNDSYFWSPDLWKQILAKILAHSPQSIGVNFFFGNIDTVKKRQLMQSPIFMDERIFYSANTNSRGIVSSPALSKIFGENTGTNDIRSDDDGVVRRFYSVISPVNHISQRLISRNLLGVELKKYTPSAGSTPFINFQGPQRSYQSYSLKQLLRNEIPKDQLKDKIVIVGAKGLRSHTYTTPIGPMTSSEILANMVDNILADRWIFETPHYISIIALFLILLVSIWAMSTYPHSVALVALFWISMGWTAFSIWIFDSQNFWIPILSPLCQIGVTYVVFLSYQLTIRDYEKWQLEQESRYLREVEQLKNNFVSLISHDLKTPIAKIQAICDRVLTMNSNLEFKSDLTNLRRESSELHRYIQTILQITRVEARDFKLNKDAADINEIIETVIEKLRPLLQQKSISVHMELEPMFLIEIDSILIQEVILNIVENAIKYSDHNCAISITSIEMNDAITVTIEDQGSGIPIEHQDQIFNKFYRGNQEKSTIKGSGLGLYLVKYFIELHNGEIRLESEVGKGTKITFTLPTFDDSNLITEPQRSIDKPGQEKL